MSERSFYTLAVHAGEEREAHFGAVSVPVYNASVYAFPDAEEAASIHNEFKHGYYYGRLGNPTTEALESTVAELESGEACLAFASGMAAVSAAILSHVRAGDHIVAPESMYSTTMNLLRHLGENLRIETTFIDASRPENYRDAARPNTRIFWLESPSNPLLTITDLKAVSEIATAAGVLTVADNTFATPFNQRPIELGVDVVIHSGTKYLGGHSDITAGLLVSTSERAKHIRSVATKLFGGTIAPQVAWLTMRGIKTLALRMERHNNNAFALADMLKDQPNIAAVYYPGIEDHPNYRTAAQQMSGFGGMISFDLGNSEAGKAFVNNVRLCTIATSLGGVETIVQHAASMTHASIPAEERRRAGISDGLIRMSVGIEDVEDLKADVRQALEAL
ncbi:MAG TPA: PLP-dependent aspartate aminotransferase family protein [Pyrinomonadaceae bacterium]|jgi:methionine-gamma-lyase